MRHKSFSFLFVILFTLSLFVLVGSVIYSVSLSSSNVIDSNTITEPNNVTHLQINNAVSPYDGLVGYWSFDGDNTTTAYDLSGNNNDGTYTGGAYSNGTTGVYDNAAVFDGVDDVVNVSNSASLNISGNITLSAWVYLNPGIAGNGDIIHKLNGATTSYLLIYVNADSSLRIYSAGFGPVVVSVPKGVWLHVLGVNNGTNLSLYINGTLRGTSAGTPLVGSTTNLYIGARPTGGNFFNGSLDDVMIFNKSLTQAEITAIYTNSSARFKSSGTTTLKQQTLTEKAGVVNLTINATEKLLGSNVAGRVAFWDKSAEYKTYNETGYASFDGVNDYVNISGLSRSAIGKNSTFSFWVNYKGNLSAGYTPMIALSSTDRTYNFFIGKDSGNGNIGVEDGSWNPNSGISINPNIWYYITFVRTNDGGITYLNGVASTSNMTFSNSLDTGKISIGLENQGPWYLNGSIDDVMIFNRSLNSTEITDIYNLNRSKYNGSTSGLVSYYSFNSLSPRDDFGNNSGTSTNGVSYSPKNTASNFNLSGLVGYWSGDGNANDYSGNGNDGVLNNGALTNASGVFNNSFGFDGSNDYVSTFDANLVSNFTTSLWYKSNSLSATQTIISDYDSSVGNQGWALQFRTTNSITFSHGGSGGYENQDTGLVGMDGNWHHLVAVVNDTGVSVYNDNVRASVVFAPTKPIGNSGYLIQIGRSPVNANYFNGSIDEVMIFNRSLSATEINELYIKGLANWNYSGVSWQNFGNNQFVSGSTTNILPEINLTANSTSLFYSPVAWWNVNFSTINSVVPTYSVDTTSANSTQNWIFANFTVDYEQLIVFSNITLYNNTGLVNSSSARGINFTNLPNAIYYLNGTVTSTSGIVNNLTTRIIISDNVNSTLNIISPQNNTFSNNGTINFTANSSDNVGIKNATLNITDLSGNNWGSFDGSTNYVYSNSVVINSSSTISFWLKPLGKGTGGGNYLPLITTSTLTALSIRQDGTILYYTNNVSGSADNWVTNDGAFNLFDGSWHNFIFNYNGTHKLIYIDGVLTQSRLATPIGINTPGINIGANGNSYNGSMEEIRIYNRSLSQTEISTLYSSGIKRNASLTTTDLVAWYDFESPSNSTRLVDKANGLYNGTINGMTYTNSYSSTTSYSPGITSTTVGIVINLVDSVYSWFWKIFDFVGNSVIASNQYLTVDTVYPSWVFHAPANLSFFNSTSVLYNITSSTSPNASIVPNLDNSLVSWWRMDDLNATGGVVDYMGRNNGTNVGASQVTNGKFGKAMSFDGATNYIALPNDIVSTSNIRLYGVSYSAWVKTTSATKKQKIVGQKPHSGYSDWSSGGIDITSGKARMIAYEEGSSYKYSTGGTTLQNDVWYFIVGVYNSSSKNMSIYLNGNIDGIQTTVSNVSVIGGNNANSIGYQAYVAGPDYFNGSIDDVMIFNRSLSADEILSLYNATAYQHTETLSQGNHTFNSYVQDSAGNVNQTGLVTFNVDTTFPTLSVETPLNDSYSNSATNNFNATAVDTANNVSLFMDLDNSLVSWWRMDDTNSTGTLVQDYMNRNNGTAINGAAQVTNGKFGKAFSFDGVNDYVLSANNISVNNGNFTVNVWVNQIGTGNTYGPMVGSGISYVASKPANSGFGFWRAYSTPNIVYFSIANSTNASNIYLTTPSVTVPLNQWSMLTATFNKNTSTAIVYLNGIYQTNTSNINVTSFLDDKLSIGKDVSQYFNGSIDELMIFNRSLSASEIASLYANSSTKYLNATVSGLSDGVHNYKIYTQDLAGNVNSTATRTLNVDTILPVVSFVSLTENNGTYFNRTWVYANVSSTDTNQLSTVVNLDNSLVSWWRMDDTNSTGTLVQDYMNRNNGTAINGAVQVTNGKFGKAFSFEGTDDYVRFSSPLSGNINVSAFMWIYDKQNTVERHMLGLNGFRDFYVYNTGMYQYYDARCLGNGIQNSTRIISNDIWYHVGYTYVSNVSGTYGNMTIWLNGQSYGSALCNISVTSGQSYIGQKYSTLRYWNGSIDEVIIFNRSLSQAEISALYNSTATQYSNNFTGLTEGTHSFKAYTQDLAGNVNSTDLRYQTLDRTASSVNLTTPLGNTTTNQSLQNLSMNVSDNIGIQNGTLYVYNSTDNSLYYNQSVTGFGSGKALSFNSSNSSYVNLGNSSYINFNDSFTISAWFYSNSPTTNGYIFNKKNGYGEGYSLMAKPSGSGMGLIIEDINGNSPSVGYYPAFPTGNWTHIVGIYNKTSRNITLYTNNILRAAINDTTNSSIQSSINASIGRGGVYGSTEYFNGSIDEVVIWNRTLNSTEISQLYNSGAGLYANTSIAPFNSGLVAGYHFDEESGTIAADITGNNNGTLINGPTYVTGKVKSPTETTFDSGVLSATIGIVIELAEGIYTWFYQFFDWAGNSGNSANNTLTIDQTYPLIEFDSSNPTNGTGLSELFNISALINETNIANMTLYFNSTNYVYPFNTTYFTLVSGNQYLFRVEKGPLGPTEQINYNLTVTDSAGQSNSTGTRLITGNQPPSLVSLVQSPTTNASLDPLVLVEINATLRDGQNNFESAWLQVSNSSSDWSNLIENILMTNTGNLTNMILNASFTLPAYEANISYRIFANDSVGGEANLSVYNISSYWDCTWNVSTNTLAEVSGSFIEKELGNVTVTNTGDSNYTGGCVVRYTVSNAKGFSDEYRDSTFGSVFEGIYFNPSQIFSLTPGNNYIIAATGGFPSSELVLVERPYFTITSNVTDSLENASVRTVNSTMIIATGAVLYQDIESPSSSTVVVPLRVQNLSWRSYVRNLGGDGTENNTAYNVSFNWTMDSILSDKIIEGNLSPQIYGNLTDSTKQYSNLTIGFTKENMEANAPSSTSSYNVTIYSFGYENTTSNLTLIESGSNITLLEKYFTISFQCEGNDTDGACPSSCNYQTDTACAEPPTGGGSTPSGGGGGGGGGAGGGGSFAKSSANFELVRGDNQEFDLTLENKLSYAKKDITITVKGNNSQYVIPTPSTIDYLGANSKENVKFLINAPSYFASGKYLLEITFSGTIEGNVSTKFTEVKYVTLTILEMNRATADEYFNSSLEILSKMNSSGLILDEVQSILDSMNANYESLNFNLMKEEADKIEEIYTAANEYSKLKEELNQSMIESEINGVETPETKKLFLLAEILFNRGDYVAAYAKLKEAKTSYLLETKGEFKLLYAIKNNPVETLGILISLSAIGLGSSYFVRLRLLKRKLRMLTEEEGLLLQLMRVVQRDCFESNKMSMEEYGESMYQYESRLSFIIQDKVTTETQVANLMKLGGKKKALGQEKNRLTNLIRETQDDYMNRGKLDTRIYENMLKTYATRLSKIEEQLVFIEAQEQIDQVNGFWKRLFDRK